MKTTLYQKKIQRIAVTLTFLVGGLPDRDTLLDAALYNILEGVAKGHEGERTYDGRAYHLVLEEASAVTKKRPV